MQTVYRIFLVAILALAAQPISDERVLAQDKGEKFPTGFHHVFSGRNAPIQTYRKTYRFAITPRSVKFTINYSYVNRTGNTVLLPTCVRPRRPLIEKKVEGRWVVAFESVELLCAGPPVRIEPGETYRDTFEVEAFLPGNNMHPKLKMDVGEIEGVYRLAHVFTGQNRPLSIEDRVSNEFKLTR